MIKEDMSLADLLVHTQVNFVRVIAIQLLLFVGGTGVQIFFFRWYNCVAAVVGLMCTIGGYFGQRLRNQRMLLVYLNGQWLGAIMVFGGTMWTFYSLAAINNNTQCAQAGGSQANCDAGVFVVAAAAAPFLFTSFALGGVYCKRLINMWESEDSGSSLDVYADFGATQFGVE